MPDMHSRATLKGIADESFLRIMALWRRSTESGAMHLLLSVPRVEGADLRPWVPPEHSLVISSARNPARSGRPEASRGSHDASNVLNWDSASFLTLDMETAAQMSVIKLKVRSLQCLTTVLTTIEEHPDFNCCDLEPVSVVELYEMLLMTNNG